MSLGLKPLMKAAQLDGDLLLFATYPYSVTVCQLTNFSLWQSYFHRHVNGSGSGAGSGNMRCLVGFVTISVVIYCHDGQANA